jgi:hypothetical protein
MTQALSSDEKAIKRYERAVFTAQTALARVVEIHAESKDSLGLTYCSLCFKNWPCESFKTAEAAITKMKGQLPQ